MSDIVERLRALSAAKHDDVSVGEEAAAEIERLRATLSEIIERLDQGQMAEPRDVASLALNGQSPKQKSPPR